MAGLMTSTDHRKKLMLTLALTIVLVILILRRRRKRRRRISRSPARRIVEMPSNLMIDRTEDSVDDKSNVSGQPVEGEEDFDVLDDEVSSTTPTDKGNQSDAISRPKKKLRYSNSADIEVDDDDDDEEEEVDDDVDDELKSLLMKAVHLLETLAGESEKHNTQRAMLFKEIEKVPGITKGQAMDAAISLVKDTNRMELFFALESDEQRKELIECVLRR
ncbi:hypothetical protein LINGRAPRIM_LOCUS1843 [Linum grandiflorum]